MTLAELFQIVRSELDDIVLPYRWTDGDLLVYANAAEAEACRRARLLLDSTTPAICRVAVVAGTASYALDERIILIRRAKLPNLPPLARETTRNLDGMVSDWESMTGTPRAFVTDQDAGRLRLIPIPVADGTLTLTVHRLPLAAMNDLQDSPEIPARYHHDLRHWMRHLAYLKRDEATYNPQQSALAAAEFEARFGPAVDFATEVWNERNDPLDGYDGG